MNLKRQSGGNSALIATVAIIWGCATAMMAVCIPMIDMTDDAIILPIFIILGASISTVVAWRSGSRQKGEIDELTNNFRTIQERVIDLETICSAQELEINKKFEQLEPTDQHRSRS